MLLNVFGRIQEIKHPKHTEDSTDFEDPHRVEVALVGPTELQYKVILLDADDSFDVIIHYPDGTRECLWTLLKDS